MPSQPMQSRSDPEADGLGFSARKHNCERRRQALLRAATELFATQGYDCTTTRQISARAGCAEGLIHRYFNGKAGLLQASMEAEAARAASEIDELLPQPADLEEEIIRLLQGEIDGLWRHREFLQVAVPHALLQPGTETHLRQVLGPDRRKQAVLQRLRKLPQDALLGGEELESLAETLVTLGLGLVLARHLVFGSSLGETRRLAQRIARSLYAGVQRAPQIASSAVSAGTEDSDAY